MLALFLGSFLFAAAFATMFLWFFKFRRIEYVNAKNQRQLIWGVTVLSLSLLFLVLSSSNLTEGRPWLVSALSFLLGLSGLSLVFAGLFGFGRRAKEEHLRLAKAENWLGLLVDLGEKVERAKNFREFCDLILNSFAGGETKAALWRLAPDGRSLVPLAFSGLDPAKTAALESVKLEKSWFYQTVRAAVPFFITGDLEIYSDYYRLFNPEERMGKAAFVPILVQGNVVGVLALFYPSAEPFLPEERALFGYLSTFLGSAFQNLLTVGYLARQEKQTRFSGKLLELSTGSPKPEKMITGLFRLAERALSADFLIFSVLEPKGLRIRRFTVGRQGQLLSDKIPFRPEEPTWLAEPTRGRLVFSRQSDFGPRGPDEKFLHSLGAKSFAFISFELPHQWATGLALGFTSSPVWGEEEEKLFHRLSEAAQNFALRFQADLLAEETERRLLSFVESSRFFLETKSEKDLVEQAGFVLTQELPVSFSRFWKAQGEVLETLSFSALRNISRDLKLEKRVPLTDLPFHRMALDEGRTVIVNQDDPEAWMSDEEKNKALVPQVQGAVLIPMQVEGDRVGLVALGEMRNWKRRAFSPTDLAFAKGIANQMALVLAHLESKLTHKQVKERLDGLEQQILRAGRTSQALELFPNFEYSINNPLTAIIGAVEVMRLKSEDLTPERARYLEIIEKQATRIGETVRRFGDLKGSLREMPAPKKAFPLTEEPGR